MNDLRRCLLELDVAGACAVWAAKSPHLPQPKDHAEALITLHHARTQAKSIPLRDRAYSHRWLVDRGHPSGLPDELKPKAERLFPEIREGVGIAVFGTSSLGKEVAPLIRDAMSDAVEECYAYGQRDPDILRERMLEVRSATIKSLLGRKR